MRLPTSALCAPLAFCFLFSACSDPEPSNEESSEEETVEVNSSKKGTLLELAGDNSSSEILPIPPGLLEAPPTPVKGDLGVLMVGPQGPQEAPLQAVIVFDRPMVALTDLDTMNATVPIECGPDLQGKARWAGTTTAVWIPDDGRFPLSSSLECSIPKGTASLDGASLEEDLVWRFRTPTLKVVDSWPRNQAKQVDPDEKILLVFNQTVSPEKLEPFLAVKAGTTPVAYTLSTPEEALNWRYPEDLSRAVLVDADLQLNQHYFVELARGARGNEGTQGTEGKLHREFTTIPPPSIENFGPLGDDISPYTQIELKMLTETEGIDIASHIHLSPEPPGEWNPSQDWSSTWWSHGVLLEPVTTYTVTLDPGLKDRYGQSYAQGASWTFTTGHHGPLIDVSQSVEIFPANNPKTLPLRSRNLTNLYASVRPVTPSWLMQAGGAATTTTGNPTPSARHDLSSEVAQSDRIRLHELDLTEALDQGFGLVAVEVWSPEVQGSRWNSSTRSYEPFTTVHRSVLQVTNLGATVKIGSNGVQTWVTDLTEGNPVANAQVEIYRAGSRQWVGQTDSSGIAKAPDLVPEDWNSWRDPFWVVVSKDGDQVVSGENLGSRLGTWEHGISTSSPVRDQGLRSHTFTDRGVYKQGETAHVALSARITTADGLRHPQQSSFDYECTDANGGALATAKGQSLGRHSTASFDVELPEDMPLGSATCKLVIEADGLSSYEWVQLPVFTYRVPSFRVDVEGPEHAMVGDKLTVRGNGRYLFGAPMAGAKATWSVRTTDSNPQPDGWEAYQFGSQEDNWWSYDEYDSWEYESSSLVDAGEGVLDSQGQLAVELEIPTTETPETRIFTYEVAVTDVARQEIANRTQVEIHPAEAYVGLKRGGGIPKAGSSASFEYVVVDPQGRVLEGLDVGVKISRRTWDSIRQKGMNGRWEWTTNIVDEEAASLQLRSEAKSAQARWTPEQGGLFVIQATVRDSAGRMSQTENQVYVAGSGASWARGDSNKLDLVPDKRLYKPGDVADILVKAPRAGMKALITVEREGIREQEVRTLSSTSETIQISVAEDAIPNLFVSVILVDGAPPNDSPEGTVPTWYMGIVELDVEPVGKHLEVSIATDSKRYGPGATVQATVQVERDGVPVEDAHVVLYAVDYGVLSLTGYQTPDAFDGYYAHLPLRVYTHDSRTRILDRGQYLSKGASPGGGDEAGDGIRERFVTTPLWRPDLETNGQGKTEVNFQLPDNLTTFQLMAVVDAGSDSFGSGEQQVIITREIIARPALPRFFRTGDEATAGVVIHNNTDGPLSIEVQAEASGIDLAGAPVTVKVAAGGATEVPFQLSNPQVGEAVFHFEATGGSYRDAVQWTVPVARPQPVETVASAGSTRDTETEQIGPLTDILPGVGGLHVSVSPTVLVGAQSSLEYLLDYPHGCLEQTTSRIMAAILAQELRDRIELSTSDETLEQYINSGLAMLPNFEHYSGGYAYWPEGRHPAPVPTAYALEVTHRAGKPVSREQLQFLHKFMNGEYQSEWWSKSEQLSAKTRVALSLARLGDGDAGHNAHLYSSRQMLSLTAKAELLEAIALTSGVDQRTRMLRQEIEAATYVEGSIVRIRDPESIHSRVLWASDLTPTAAAVSALVSAYPEHALLERLAKGLVRSRKSGRWSNTYTTLKAFAALSDYAQQIEGDVSETQVTLHFDGDVLLKHIFEEPRSTSATVEMKTGLDGKLKISAAGGLVYYESRLSYAREEMPPRDEGFTLIRRYQLLEGTGAGKEVTPGSVVQVNLRVVTPVERTDVAIIDPLPAGLEPINQGFATTAQRDLQGSSDELRWSSWVFDHREMDDDELRLYASYMPAGIHTYRYLARATTPGEYALPAATVEEMYRPENFGRTEQGRFIVGSPQVARAD